MRKKYIIGSIGGIAVIMAAAAVSVNAIGEQVTGQTTVAIESLEKNISENEEAELVEVTKNISFNGLARKQSIEEREAEEAKQIESAAEASKEMEEVQQKEAEEQTLKEQEEVKKMESAKQESIEAASRKAEATVREAKEEKARQESIEQESREEAARQESIERESREEAARQESIEQAERKKTTGQKVNQSGQKEYENFHASTAVSVKNVPLDAELTGYIIETSNSYGVDPSITFAVIFRESSFNSHAVSRKGSIGLMQVHPAYNGVRMARLGITNLFDPYQNVLAGIDCLAEYVRTYHGDYTKVLTSYRYGTPNGSHDYASLVLSSVSRFR